MWSTIPDGYFTPPTAEVHPVPGSSDAGHQAGPLVDGIPAVRQGLRCPHHAADHTGGPLPRGAGPGSNDFVAHTNNALSVPIYRDGVAVNPAKDCSQQGLLPPILSPTTPDLKISFSQYYEKKNKSSPIDEI